MNTADRLAAELAALFGIPEDEARLLDRATSEKWDSLKHIEVLYLIEEEFDVTPTAEAIPGLDSFDALVAYLSEALSA